MILLIRYATTILSVFIINTCLAQSAKTKNIKVWGNCGTCKKKIEKAAKSGGAETASWNEKTKFLTVSYKPAISNTNKIEQAVAAKGYDTQNVKADEQAYKKLDACCRYKRK